MDWLNVFGLMIMAVIMIPNIVFAIKCKDGFENKRKKNRRGRGTNWEIRMLWIYDRPYSRNLVRVVVG
mgnify:CR=1 FL=1